MSDDPEAPPDAPPDEEAPAEEAPAEEPQEALPEETPEPPPEEVAEPPPEEAPEPPPEETPEPPPEEAPEPPPEEAPEPPPEETPDQPPDETPEPPPEPAPEEPAEPASEEAPPPEEPPADEDGPPAPAEETQLASPQPDTGGIDEAPMDDGIPPEIQAIKERCSITKSVVLKMFPSLMTTSMVEGQKTPDPEKEPNFELMRALIYEENKQGTGFALPTEYGPKDVPSEALPKPTQSEENEQQTEEDMLAKEHELEVLRSLIYEEREEHGFKLPTEYGPHGLAAPELGSGAKAMQRVPRNIAQQILDVLGGREAFPANECDECSDDSCDDDSVMSFMADLVLGVVEVVAERLFKTKQDCVPLAETISKGITAISTAVSKQGLPEEAAEAAESVSALMKKSMAEMLSNAVSQKASEIGNELAAGAFSTQNIQDGLKAASKVIEEKLSVVANEAAAEAEEPAPDADEASAEEPPPDVPEAPAEEPPPDVGEVAAPEQDGE